VLRLVLRGRLPRPAPEVLETLSSAPGHTKRLADAIAASRAPSPESTGTDEIDASAGLPSWLCEERAGWTGRVQRAVDYPSQPAGLTARTMHAPGFEGWPYMVYVPDTYRPDAPAPLLIYLSGSQGRATFGVSASGRPIDEADGAGGLVIFPEARGYWWHARSVAIVEALLDEALRGFNVDTDRVSVAGFSNGGTGALHLATLWPQRFASAVSLMGAGAFRAEADPPLLRNAAGLPLAFYHGADDPVIPAQASRRTVERLEREGADRIELEVLKGRGHDLVIGSVDGRTFAFTGRHRRDPLPHEIAFEAVDLTHPRHYWVEFLEKQPGLAEVRGTWRPGRVRLTTRRVVRLRLLLRREQLGPDRALEVEVNGRELFRDVVLADCALLHRSLGRTADPGLAWSAEVEIAVPAGP
jgi:dienelactone hydrolase